MITEIYFPVKRSEIDSLEIVHHSHYPIWFEAGRNDFFKNAGLPHYKMNASGFFLPLMEMKCNYKYPAKFGDIILLKTNMVYLSYFKVKFEYILINKLTGKVLVTGKTIHAWTNKKLEPLNIGKATPEIYNRLKQFESTSIL